MRVNISHNKSLKGHTLLLLLPDDLPATPLDAIRSRFPELRILARRQPWADADAHAHVPDAEWSLVTILVTGSALPLKEKAPRLQYVQLISAGANHVLDNPLFTDTDVAFCTANGVHGPQISEWVISTYLALQHHLPKYLEQQKQGTWKRLPDPVDDAVSKRVLIASPRGILGYGSIGRQVARVCHAMGMSIHAYTLHPRDTPASRRDPSYAPPNTGDIPGDLPSRWFSGASTAAIHEFLASDLDLLVVCLPLTPKTRGLISAPEFEVLAANKTFVSNISRGPIVNTDHLIAALEHGVVRGAALDVTDPEPLPEGHRLWGVRNLIVTPHVSGNSTAYTRRVLDILRLNLERLSEGGELINRVNRKEGY
ncbi:hypothetical protein S40293_07613 [Stachybotrys chartarum IBT 40293]|nr:hypothetical protein S40293_07613 [Stachybotrys chartarum IBT 40293]